VKTDCVICTSELELENNSYIDAESALKVLERAFPQTIEPKTI